MQSLNMEIATGDVGFVVSGAFGVLWAVTALLRVRSMMKVAMVMFVRAT